MLPPCHDFYHGRILYNHYTVVDNNYTVVDNHYTVVEYNHWMHPVRWVLPRTCSPTIRSC